MRGINQTLFAGGFFEAYQAGKGHMNNDLIFTSSIRLEQGIQECINNRVKDKNHAG